MLYIHSFKKNLPSVFFFFFGLLSFTTAAYGQADSSYRKITFTKTVSLPAQGELHIQLKTPARVEITAATSNQCTIEVQLEGPALVVDLKPQGSEWQLVSYYEKAAASASAVGKGVVRIQLPASAVADIDMWEGDLAVHNLTTSLKAIVQKGNIQLTNVSGTVAGHALQGNIACKGGSLTGSLSCGKGQLSVEQVKGSFGMACPAADFQVVSPNQPVVASLTNSHVDVQVKEGNVRGTLNGVHAQIHWKGEKSVQGTAMQFTVNGGQLALYLPEGMGADFSVMQLSGTGQSSGLQSDFGSLQKVVDRTVIEQGKDKRMQKNTHTVSGGGNQVTIIAHDSVIALKKG